VTHNNDKGKYGIISFEMNQTIHSNNIISSRSIIGKDNRSIVGKNKDISGKNISMSRNIGRSMSRSMSRNMSRSIKRKITNEKKINQRNIMSRSSKNNRKILF